MSKGLEALERLNKDMIFYENGIDEERHNDDYLSIEKELKSLNEIVALYNKWLGNEISDFEFFTLLAEIKDKYDLLKEALL